MRLLLDESVPARLYKALPIAIVVLDSHSIELNSLLPLMAAREAALATLQPRTYVLVAGTE